MKCVRRIQSWDKLEVYIPEKCELPLDSKTTIVKNIALVYDIQEPFMKTFLRELFYLTWQKYVEHWCKLDSWYVNMSYRDSSTCTLTCEHSFRVLYEEDVQWTPGAEMDVDVETEIQYYDPQFDDTTQIHCHTFSTRMRFT